MDIPRIVQDQIESKIGQQKVILLYGTRRTGKTTIIEKIVQKFLSDALLCMEKICRYRLFYKIEPLLIINS